MEEKKEVKKLPPIPKFIGIEDILRITTQGVFIGNRKLKPEEKQALKADAQHFAESFIWQMVRQEIHYISYMRATNKAKNQEDINYANAMYSNLETIEQFINNCRTL